MIAVIQRVAAARVTVAQETVGEIGPGICALVSVHADDTEPDIMWTMNKILTMRIFTNAEKYFDLDIQQIAGKVLLVSNFTVAADTRSGRRPSLNGAAGPEMGRKYFDLLVEKMRASGIDVETGRFGADMRVSIENDGPVTFILDSRDSRKPGA